MVAPRTATTSPSRLTSLSVYSPTMRSDSSAKFIAPERIRESGGINSAASNRPSNRYQPGRRYGWSLGVRPVIRKRRSSAIRTAGQGAESRRERLHPRARAGNGERCRYGERRKLSSGPGRERGIERAGRVHPVDIGCEREYLPERR